jgi:hypothetical protein
MRFVRFFGFGHRLTPAYFNGVKADTNGLMHPAVYFAFYNLALRGNSNVIDVGVGRGGTSIAFALGIKESGRASIVHAIDQFSQHSRGPHRYSLATHPQDCAALNLAEFRANVERYEVSHLVQPWVGTTDAVAPHLPVHLKADLLSIDVDGMIDRDLDHFYDFVQPGGRIVLDDYSDTIVSTGRMQVAKMRGQPESQIRAWIAEGGSFKARRLLGKHLLTYRLAKYFESIGAIILERTLGPQGKTAVFRKPTNAPFSSFDLSGIPDIEADIVTRFLSLCAPAENPCGP